MLEYIWVLLPLGLLIGWLAAKQEGKRRHNFLQQLNLRYFLEEGREREEAHQEIITRAGDEAARFSLILGDAFRARGEIDQAIKLHRYVLEESRYPETIAQAHYALAQDYLAGGFFDRAESGLILMKKNPDFRDEALRLLAKLYQQQRLWDEALKSYRALKEPLQKERMIMAHLLCEKAEKEAKSHNSAYPLIARWLDEATEYDPDLIRPSMIRTRLLIKEGRFEEAFETIKQMEAHRSPLYSLMIPLFASLASRLDRLEEYERWLTRLSLGRTDFAYKIAMTHLLIEHSSFLEGLVYLKDALYETPNLEGLILLSKLQKVKERLEESKSGESRYLYDDFGLMRHILEHRIDRYAQFKCRSCHFSTQTLHWQCPSCEEWNTSTPVSDIIALKNR